MFGITIRASESAKPFWDMVERASVFEEASSVGALNYAPHVTLARYERIDPQRLVRGLDALSNAAPLTLTFGSVETFGPEPMILWLKPRANHDLENIQARLYSFVGTTGSDPHYLPENWVPHCTLASAVRANRAEAAALFARKPIEPFALTFDVVDALQWPPVMQLGSRNLRRAVVAGEGP